MVYDPQSQKDCSLVGEADTEEIIAIHSMKIAQSGILTKIGRVPKW